MSILHRFNTGINYLSQPILAPVCNVASVPDAIKVNGGVSLVIGCHPCWKEDMDAALAHYPDAKICAVNYAAELVCGEYIASVHGYCMPDFLALHHKTWPNAKRPIMIQRDCSDAIEMDGLYSVDARTHSSSGSFAAAAMAMIGFDLAIMCGSPITGTGGYAQSVYDVDDWHGRDRNRINAWHMGMRQFKEQFPEIASKMRSMSGTTKDIFGGIE